MLIGISGFAQSGKSTIAQYLESKGFVRKHIATPLRAMLTPLLVEFGIPKGTQGTQPGERPNTYDYLEGRLKEEIIPEIGMSGRKLQITLGTEWGRVQVDPALWINAWDAPLTEDDNVINDSVRFPNEEAPVYAKGGFTLMVERPGVGPRAFKWGSFGKFLYEKFGIWLGVHDSERADRLNPRYRIINDGSLEELYAKLDELFLPLLPEAILPVEITGLVAFTGDRAIGKTVAAKALKYYHKIDNRGFELYAPARFNRTQLLRITSLTEVRAKGGIIIDIQKGDEKKQPDIADHIVLNNSTEKALQRQIHNIFSGKAA